MQQTAQLSALWLAAKAAGKLLAYLLADQPSLVRSMVVRPRTANWRASKLFSLLRKTTEIHYLRTISAWRNGAKLHGCKTNYDLDENGGSGHFLPRVHHVHHVMLIRLF